MLSDYLKNLLWFGLNYFLAFAIFIYIIRSNNKKLYFVTTIISLIIFTLIVFPALNPNIQQVASFFGEYFDTVKASPGFLVLVTGNLFVLFLTFYKKNYLENFRKYIVLSIVIVYSAYIARLITMEVEIILSFIVFLISIIIIIYRVNLEAKDHIKRNAKTRITATRPN